MLGLGKLTAAINTLAANLTTLAGPVAEVNAHVRGRLALDGSEADGPAALPAPGDGNGEAEALPAGRRNGRRKAAAE